MLKITILRNTEAVLTSLTKNGWHLSKTGETISATHPAASSRPELRQQLQQVGLLTSPHVRIEFTL